MTSDNPSVGQDVTADASPIPRGVFYAPVPEGLLYEHKPPASAFQVWGHVWLETLGRPGWTLSASQLAEGIGISRRTAQNAVDWLVERGWMLREHRRDSRGHSAPNLLTAVMEQRVVSGAASASQSAADCTIPTGSEWPQSAADCTIPGAVDDTTPGAAHCAHQKSHHQKSHDQEMPDPAFSSPIAVPPASSADLDGFAVAMIRPKPFDEFMATYPNGTQRPAARAAFAQATQQADVEVILDAARKYAAGEPRFHEVSPAHQWLRAKPWAHAAGGDDTHAHSSGWEGDQDATGGAVAS